MSPRHRRNIQPPLPDMPGRPPDRINPKSIHSLSHALRPGFVGIDPESAEYLDIGDDVLEQFAIPVLRRSLIDVTVNKEAAVDYLPGDTQARRRMYVAATNQEFILLAGSVKRLGTYVMRSTLYARQFAGQRDPQATAASRRGGVSAVSRKLVGLSALEQKLVDQAAFIARFQTAAKYPGRAMFGYELDLRIPLETLRTVIVGDMLEAVRFHRQWDPATEDLDQRAVDTLLFIERSDNRHIEYIRDLLGLAKEWNGHRLAVTRTKKFEAKKFKLRNEPIEE